MNHAHFSQNLTYKAIKFTLIKMVEEMFSISRLIIFAVARIHSLIINIDHISSFCVMFGKIFDRP